VERKCQGDVVPTHGMEDNNGAPDGGERLNLRPGRFIPVVLCHQCFASPVLMNLTKSF